MEELDFEQLWCIRRSQAYLDFFEIPTLESYSMWWEMFFVCFYFLVLEILDFSILHSKFQERKEPGKTDDYRISINISEIRFLQSLVSAVCLLFPSLPFFLSWVVTMWLSWSKLGIWPWKKTQTTPVMYLQQIRNISPLARPGYSILSTGSLWGIKGSGQYCHSLPTILAHI